MNIRAAARRNYTHNTATIHYTKKTIKGKLLKKQMISNETSEQWEFLLDLLMRP